AEAFLAKDDSAGMAALEGRETDRHKLIVFAHHREVVEALVERLGALRIAGEDSATERQATVDRFQTDPEARVIVCSLKAAGVGITLTAASDVVFAELDWTPAAHDQGADRAHRFGQTEPVTVWWMLTEGTIEGYMSRLLTRKAKVTASVVDGIGGADAGSIAGDLLVSLLDGDA
ncbi:MAG: helicase-related protein, partial [Acidimicrobiales bacterium]